MVRSVLLSEAVKVSLINILKSAFSKDSEYFLSSGIKNKYIGFDKMWESPIILNEISELISNIIEKEPFEKIVSVDDIFYEYGIIPITSLISVNLQKPLIICKEIDNYNYHIYGDFCEGDDLLVLYDVTALGVGLCRLVDWLEQKGANIVRIITIVDREEGARDFLAEKGYTLDFLVTLNEIEKIVNGEMLIE